MLKTCTLVVVALLISLGLTTHAFAFSADGALDDWGLTDGSSNGLTDNYGDPGTGYGPWNPTLSPAGNTTVSLVANAQGAFKEDDRYFPGSGGESYDIEAMYIDLTRSGNNVTDIYWAVVTSWNGDLADASGNWVGAGYHFQPYIAIDLGMGNPVKYGPGLPETGGALWSTGWDIGLVLGSNSDFTVTDDPSSGGSTAYKKIVNVEGASIAPTATAYNTDTTMWRGGGSPGGNAGYAPIDFTDANTPSDTWGDTTGGSSYFGMAFNGTGSTTYADPTKWYKERAIKKTNQVDADWGLRKDYKDASNNWWGYNWVWEGSMHLTNPIPVATGPSSSWQAYYGQWCANDYGKVITTGPTTLVPEPASMALLALATVAVGGAIKRRKKS